AMPRKTYLKDHLNYMIDRLIWLFDNRHVFKGLKWVYEPPIMRFFEGLLKDHDNWGLELSNIYMKHFGEF
ncbi:MAG: tryptophanase, partial [Desulfurococcaceae archaeon]